MKKHSASALLFSLLFCAVLTFGGGQSLAAPAGSPWGADYFGHIPLLTQDGKKVDFYNDLIKNKVVAINFIFTHCADSCPVETANMRQVQKALGDRVGRDVFIYSVSISPEQDSPEVLREYAHKFNAGPGWTFLTGKRADIKQLRQKFGLYRSEEDDAKKLDSHGMSMMVGNDATSQWMKRSGFDEPKVLAWVLGNYLQTNKVASAADKAQLASYNEASQFPRLSHGEELFRSRCDSCHSLGKEDGLGPGLAGVVAKRDRAWLTHWLQQPDKMLAEKDPLAIALFNQYKQLAMPNLKLSDTDVTAILEFMESHSVENP